MTIRRVNKKKGGSVVSKRKRKSDFNVSLSTKKSIPSTELGDYMIWIHGAPGVGKSTLASEFPDIHMFMAEVGGAKAIAVHQKPVRHWLEWLAYLDKLEKDKTFQTIGVDVLEQLYSLCFDYMCQEVLFIDHPQDQNDYGKSWGKITNEFMRALRKLKATEKGIVLVSHSVDKPIKTFNGEEYNLIRPNIGGSVLNAVAGEVDIIGYLYAEGRKRFLRVQEDGDHMAKVRPTKNFMWPDGEKIDVIPMGSSSHQGYLNFVAAFNNKLARPEQKPKKKKRRL